MKKKYFSRLPPDEDSHRLHSERVNYVVYINLKYQIKEAMPSLNNNGWAPSNGHCYPVRYSSSSIPNNILDLVIRSSNSVTVENEPEEDETGEAEESDDNNDNESDEEDDNEDYDY